MVDLTKLQEALQAHADGIKPAPAIPQKMLWPLQSECDAVYGNPRGAHGSYDPQWARDNLTHVYCPWPLNMGAIHIPYITIHKKVAPSLERVLKRIWDEVGHDITKIKALRYDVFSGSFVFRPMRTSSRLSMHAYGIAIDFDAPDNMLHSHKHLFAPDSLLVRAFKDEGWVWGGDWDGEGVDAMHFQAARVHS